MKRPPEFYEFNRHQAPNRVPVVRSVAFHDRDLGSVALSFADLFEKLDLPVKEIDCEGAGHFEYEFSETQIQSLRGFFVEENMEVPEAIIIGREERPPVFYVEYDEPDEDYSVTSSNPWGDLILDMQLVSGGAATNYTLTLFMDGESRCRALFQKDIIEATHEDDSLFRKIWLKLGGKIGDSLNEATGFKEITPKEQAFINSLLQMMVAIV